VRSVEIPPGKIDNFLASTADKMVVVSFAHFKACLAFSGFHLVDNPLPGEGLKGAVDRIKGN